MLFAGRGYGASLLGGKKNLPTPSLLIVVFISHSHTPLLHLHTVLHCHIVLHTWQSCIIFLFLFILIFLFFIYFLFIFLCSGWSPCTTIGADFAGATGAIVKIPWGQRPRGH